LFIRQKGKQELKVSLQTLGNNGFYPIIEPTVDINCIGGGEIVLAGDHKNTTYRLGISSPAWTGEAMVINKGEISSGTYQNISGSSGTVEANGFPDDYIIRNSNSFSLPDYKQILFNTINN